ncbi:MAG: hypothetical protein ACRCUS_01080, partial [Anaerovoracaceae bacterium]
VLEINNSGEEKKGDFGEVIFRKNKIKERDYFDTDSYMTYIGANYAITRIVNKLPINNQKILIAKDSFSRTMQPFIAFDCKEIVGIDLRKTTKPLLEIIQKERPDIVIIAYNPSSIRKETFDFFSISNQP